MTKEFGIRLLLILGAMLLSTGNASAQVGCPPGYYPLTQGPTNQSVTTCVPEAQVGLGGYGDGAGAPSSKHWILSHFAVAWHRNASDAWIATGFRSADAASDAALGACNVSMGQGCTIGLAAANGYVAIARDGQGTMWAGGEYTEAKARKSALELCHQTANAQCSVIRTAKSRSWLEDIGGTEFDNAAVLAPKGDFRRWYGTAAWVDSEKIVGEWDSKVWVSTGHSTPESSSAAAVGACEKASGLRCVATRTVNDTILTIAVDAAGSVRVGASPVYKTAQKDAEARCKQTGMQCTVSGLFDVSRKGDWMLDPFEDAAGKKE